MALVVSSEAADFPALILPTLKSFLAAERLSMLMQVKTPISGGLSKAAPTTSALLLASI